VAQTCNASIDACRQVLSAFIYVQRYRCASPGCGWQGLRRSNRLGRRPRRLQPAAGDVSALIRSASTCARKLGPQTPQIAAAGSLRPPNTAAGHASRPSPPGSQTSGRTGSALPKAAAKSNSSRSHPRAGRQAGQQFHAVAPMRDGPRRALFRQRPAASCRRPLAPAAARHLPREQDMLPHTEVLLTARPLYAKMNNRANDS